MNTFEIKAIISDSLPLDLIIGRSTIKNIYNLTYGLVRQIPSQFEDMSRALITEGETSETPI